MEYENVKPSDFNLTIGFWIPKRTEIKWNINNLLERSINPRTAFARREDVQSYICKDCGFATIEYDVIKNHQELCQPQGVIKRFIRQVRIWLD